MDDYVLRLDDDSATVAITEEPKAGRRARRGSLATNLVADTRGIPSAAAYQDHTQPPLRGGWGESATASLTSDTSSIAVRRSTSMAATPAQPLSPTTSSVAGLSTATAALQLDTDSGPRLLGVSRRKQEQLLHQPDQLATPSGRNARKHDDEDELDPVMEIPDLDSLKSEDITRQVAAAPHARSGQVQNIAELDSAADVRLPSAGDADDVDLSLLTACLCPSALVVEDMVVWDPELLLTQLASDLHRDREQAAALEGAAGTKGLTGEGTFM